ncbi:hypothetical protein C0993_001490, partial [Termitomyces sp. T159_Od127]
MHEFFARPRGQTTSAIAAARPRPPQSPSSGTGTLASPLSRVVSESSVPHADGRTSGFSVFGISIGAASGNARRKRKDSVDSGYQKEQDVVGSLKRRSGVSTPLMMGSPASWWAGMEEQAEGHRPWKDPPKRKKTVPQEQTEGLVHARE